MTNTPNFRYFQIEDAEDWTISGSAFALNEDGSLKWLYPITARNTRFASNHDLRTVCEAYFPNIDADPESDMFWGTAKTETEAKAFCAFMNKLSLSKPLVRDLFKAGK